MSLLNWLAGAVATVNPFDGGANWNSVMADAERKRKQQQRQPQPQQRPQQPAQGPPQWTQQFQNNPRGQAQRTGQQFADPLRVPTPRFADKVSPHQVSAQQLVNQNNEAAKQAKAEEERRKREAQKPTVLEGLNPFGEHGVFGANQQKKAKMFVDPVVEKLEGAQKWVNRNDKEEGFQWNSLGDYGRFAANLPAGMAQGIIEAPGKVGEAMSGQRVNEGAVEGINAVQRAGSLADGVISIGGIPLGGSGTLVKSVLPGAKTGASTLLQAGKQFSKDALSEGVEETAQTFAQDLSDDGQVNTGLDQYGQAFALGTLGGGMMHGAGKGIEGVRAIPAKVESDTHSLLIERNPQYAELDTAVKQSQSLRERAELQRAMKQIRRREQQGGFIAGPQATGFNDAQARGLVFEGEDGMQRFEGDDSQMKIKNPNGRTLGELIDHPELFKNYKQLKDVRVEMSSGLGSGHFDPNTNTLRVDPNLDLDKQLDTFVHENDHAIQEIEGFPGGASPRDYLRKYTMENDSIKRGLAEVNEKLNSGTLPQSDVVKLRKRRDNLIKQLEDTQDQYGNVKNGAAEAMDKYRRTAGEVYARASESRRTMPMSERYVKPSGKKLYHGSSAKFKDFSYDHIGSRVGNQMGKGFYFTNKKNTAKAYTGIGGNLMKARVDVKNPMSHSKRTLTKDNLSKFIQKFDPAGDKFLNKEYPNGDYGSKLNQFLDHYASDQGRGRLLPDSGILRLIIDKSGVSNTELRSVYETLRDTTGKDGVEFAHHNLPGTLMPIPFGQKTTVAFFPEQIIEGDKPRSTFYDSLDVPKKDLIVRKDSGKALSIDQIRNHPEILELDRKFEELGAEIDALMQEGRSQSYSQVIQKQKSQNMIISEQNKIARRLQMQGVAMSIEPSDVQPDATQQPAVETASEVTTTRRPKVTPEELNSEALAEYGIKLKPREFNAALDEVIEAKRSDLTEKRMELEAELDEIGSQDLLGEVGGAIRPEDARQYFGENYTEYINRSQLRKDAMPIDVMAQERGFDDVDTFVENMTRPLEIRKELANLDLQVAQERANPEMRSEAKELAEVRTYDQYEAEQKERALYANPLEENLPTKTAQQEYEAMMVREAKNASRPNATQRQGAGTRQSTRQTSSRQAANQKTRNANNQPFDDHTASQQSAKKSDSTRAQQQNSQSTQFRTDSEPSYTQSITDSEAKQYVNEMSKAQKDARKSSASDVKGRASEVKNDFREKFIDDLAPIEDRLNKAIKSGAKVDPKDHITYQLDRTRRAEGVTHAYIRDNGLDKIIQGVPNAKEFDQYLIAKHAQELDSEIVTGRNKAKDRALVKKLEGKYSDYAQDIYAYNQKLLDTSVEYGLIGKETAAQLKKQYPEYVPFNRIFNEDELARLSGTGGGEASLSSQSAVQRIKGSKRSIDSPLNSIIDKTRVVTEQGERNTAAKMLASYRDLPGNPFNLRRLPEGEAVGTRSSISYLEDGKKVTYLTDKTIADAAKGMTRQQIGLWGHVLSAPTRVLRTGATTANAGFAGANIVKDIVGSAINSKNTVSLGNPKVIGRALSSALHHNGKHYAELMREGVSGTSFDMYRNAPDLNIKEIRSQRNLAARAAHNARPDRWLRTIENTIGRSEDFGRGLQYYANKSAFERKGKTKAEAKLLAADEARHNATNFFRHGSYGKNINLAIPYWNAGVQGARIQGRRIAQRPVATITKMGFAIAAPSAMIALNNYDDEEKRKIIDNIPDYEKEGNIIIIGDDAKFNEETNRWDGVHKWPVPPQHLGIHTAVQEAVRSMVTGEPYKGAEHAGNVIENYTTVNPTDATKTANNYIPQLVKLIAEPMTNTNFFTREKVVSDSMKNLDPQDQKTKSTSGTARVIGKLTGASPMMIDNTIRTGTGGAGQNVVWAIDKMLEATGAIEKGTGRGRNPVESVTDRFVGARGTSSGVIYFRTLDEAAEKHKLAGKDLSIFNSLVDSKMNSRGEIEGKNERDALNKYQNLASHPKVAAAFTDAAKERSRQTGEPIDPLYQLDKDKQMKFYNIKAQNRDSQDQRDLENREAAWYKDFSEERRMYFDALDLKPGKSERVKYPEPNAKTQKLIETYYNEQDPDTKYKMLDDNPEITKHFENLADYTNNVRKEQGVNPLRTYPRASEHVDAQMDAGNFKDPEVQDYMQQLNTYNVTLEASLAQIQGNSMSSKGLKATKNLGYSIVKNEDGTYSMEFEDKQGAKNTETGDTVVESGSGSGNRGGKGGRKSSGGRKGGGKGGSKSGKDLDIATIKAAMKTSVPKTADAPKSTTQAAKMKQTQMKQYRKEDKKRMTVTVKGKKRIA